MPGLKKRIVNFLRRFYKGKHYPVRQGTNGRFIFIHINKTGGTSIAKAIGLPSRRHLFAQEIISIVGEERFRKCFKFCVVRNPWDRVVSHYHYRLKHNVTQLADKPISFKEWVLCCYGPQKNPTYFNDPKWFVPQIEWITDKNGNVATDYIIRFESLERDFLRVAQKIGLKKELPHLNATSKAHYSRFYDDETREIVGNHFRADIERFNYSFEQA